MHLNYYPFGLEIDRNSPVVGLNVRNDLNRKLYLGKELQVGTGYLDLSRRFYDPTIGRFMQVDPLSEKMPVWSPYSYGFNNPIIFVDPPGMAPTSRLNTHTSASAGGGGQYIQLIHIMASKTKVVQKIYSQ
ncbi:RHS repeat domain-containing protein [Dyadobacter jejuensis]|uniref:RHS repeat domain-containing protein n=1 Tax=Dyadobacter jejuensis TaxID=1082580 RepID=UPI000D6B1A47|nr:RHS repeat-associated core domain-containing protein [Dyadobacter jejuensis]